MPEKFRSLTDVINNDSALSKFRKSVTEQDVLTQFSTIFPSLGKTVVPKNINRGILYLTVENSVLRNEIYLNRKTLVEKINKHFKQNIIVEIKFTSF